MKKGFVIGTSIALLLIAVSVEIASPPSPRLIYNKSESAPIGLYFIDPKGDAKKDALVAAFAPDDARKLAAERGYLPSHIPLIKTVWAVAGDKICAKNGVIKTANQPEIIAFSVDSAGRPMPSWKGCVTLNEREIFLVSSHTKSSFDSRYFGTVTTDNVLGTAHFLGKSQ